MKKWMLLIAVTAIIAACNEEPKMTQQEETAVETQINSDQKAMDSLEAAIKAQMDELGADSLEMDSL